LLLDPTTPDIDAKLAATISSTKPQPPKSIKRKLHNGDDLCPVIQNTPALGDDDGSDADNNADCDNTEPIINPGWIVILIDKPLGE